VNAGNGGPEEVYQRVSATSLRRDC